MRKGVHVVPTAGKGALYPLAAPGIWQCGTIVCAAIISSSAYVLMARTLDPRYFGSYLFVQWLASIVAPTIGAGMSTLASQQIAAIQCRESPRMIAGIFYFLWHRQYCRIRLYCLWYLLLALSLSSCFHLYPLSQLLLAGLSTLPLLLSNVAGTTLRSLRRSDLLTMLQLVTVLLSLLLIVVAMQINGKPIEAFQLAFALASTLTLILAIICVIHLLPLEKALQPGIFLKERIQHSLTHSRLLVFSDAIIWQRGEFLFLAYRCTPAEVGFYMLGSIISSSVVGLAPFLLANIIEPVLRMGASPVPTKKGRGIYLNPYDAFVKKSCYLALLAVPLCMLLMCFAPGLVIFCLGTSYEPLIVPLRIMLIASGFGSIATVSVTHLATLPAQAPTRVRFQFLLALLKVNLVLILSARWGITGAAIASTLAQVLSACHSILFCRHMLRKHELRM
jgi:hypothetical protein